MTQSTKKRALVCGGGGFIGSHLAKHLRDNLGYHVVVADRKFNEFRDKDEFCDDFHKVDLRSLKNCLEVTANIDEVYNLAADMGGMGFIQSNESVLFFNNTLISANVLEASRRNKVSRYFYASSACCYNESKQLDTDNVGLKESDAWPAAPQDTYGLEKLYSEEMAMQFGKDFGFAVRIARFHNIYGPYGTWFGGREKAPAAFCRKAVVAQPGDTVQIWGDGEQTRSFCYVDDCVEGIIRIMHSDFEKPLNLGSEEMISINDLAKLALSFDGKDSNVTLGHIEGPTGVRGRNSDNTLIRQVFGWAPSISLRDGLRRTYTWIKKQVEAERAAGNDTDFSVSKVCQQTADDLDDLVVDN